MPLTAQELDDLEEIVVTGSFIARPADRPQPVTVIDNTELINQYRGSVAEVFKDLPEVSGTVSTINWSEGQDSPTNTVNLRGLGARATLVLLNSKRQTTDGSSNSQGFSAVDINNLAPPIMIERIEVLSDGASALYGSDAVAGVVNFITRNDFEGAELRVNTLWTEAADTGTPEYNIAGLFGTQGDTT
ncbi:MAG: TonB-dependent receptor plug domain-containing protein, partial [Rhodospirillaceae bacterium]|nr:TonB-dependent receptor plug domain-containing protein [Rhodospirillaceae bacterium]